MAQESKVIFLFLSDNSDIVERSAVLGPVSPAWPELRSQ